MPSYPRHAFTLEDAHAAALAAGYRPTRLSNRSRFSFNSAACHVGGDSPSGCWANERDGRVYFNCHMHGGSKNAWMEAQGRITANLGLPEYEPPKIALGGGKAYEIREWTYHNPTTGESAVQVVERYDGPCYREDCPERWAHKHPWLRRDETFQGEPTDGFLLLEHAIDTIAARDIQAENRPESPDSGGAEVFSEDISCISCISCQDQGCAECLGKANRVVIAEGETTAESTAACGWRAFSYQGGANGAGRANFSPVAGLSVLYAPDNDRPGNKAALTAAVRCIEAGATDVRIMPTDCFQRRGEDLADLDPEARVQAIAIGWSTPAREQGQLILDLSIHNLTDRCRARRHRPLIEATEEEHYREHVDDVWRGIMERGDRLREPQVYVKDGRLVKLGYGTEGPHSMIDYNRNSIALEASEAVFWFKGYDDDVICQVPGADSDLLDWQDVAAKVDATQGQEYGRVQLRGGTYVMSEPKPHHPMRTVTSALLDSPPDDLPILEAVITRPFLTSDGDRLVTAEGYHQQERIYLENPRRFSPMSLPDAKAALDDLFCDFPFATEADTTNFYACVVTAFCRRAYSLAPMFMFDKPKSGTGATLLAHMVSVLATGRMPRMVTYTTEGEEFEKRMVTAVRNFNGLLLLDNLAGTVNSPMLASLVTAEDIFEARKLGGNDLITIDPRNYVMAATANNVSMAAELVNRTLPIRLDANMERPEERENFRHPEIKEYMQANLSRLQSAGLSLVQHWLDAGRPPASELPRALRRFPGWLRLTAAILESCEFRDFAANVVEFEERAVSAGETSNRRFIGWWWETHGSNVVSGQDLAPMALGDPNDDTAEGILPIRGTSEKARRTNLSKFINRLIDQAFELDDNRVKLVSVKTPGAKYQEWMLQPLDGPGGTLALHEITPGTNSEAPESVGNSLFGQCGHPLLPDEPGPNCENCQ